MNRISRRLLIVDDSPEDRELYRRYLGRDREYSYNILEATLGQQGLELWQQHQPDALLLDYRLPDLDGLEFLQRLQFATKQQSLPVIMVTGYGNEAIAVQAMKAGAQDYLVKGQITPQRLQLAVNGAIETVQLRTQLQQRIERERLVSQITDKIHQTLDLAEILQTTVTEVRQFLKCDRVLIFRLQSNGWGTVMTESVEPGWTSLLSTPFHDHCFNENYIESCRQGLVTINPDIHDGTLAPCHVEQLAKLQVRANLVVPILQNGQLWGMLIAHHCTTKRQWESLEVDLLKELATQVGIAIQQAELYQQAQNELAQRKRTEIALRDSEQRFRQISENIEAVFWVTELPERRVSYVSPAYQRLWGLKREDVYDNQQNWVNLLHPEDRQATERAFQEKALTGKFDQEYRIILPDGRVRWVRDRCFPLQDNDGKVYRLTGIAEDITERKRQELNEQFLNQLEMRLRHLTDAQAMVWEMVSSLGEYLQGNRCTLGEVDWQQRLITVEQDWCPNLPSIAGTYSLSDYLTPEFQATFAAGESAAIDDVTTDTRTAAFASNHQSSQVRAFASVPGIYQGCWIASLTIYSPIPRMWREDEVALLQATVARVCPLIEQTRAIQALRASQERLRLVTHAVNGLIFDWNLQTNKVYRSEKLYDLLGFYPEDIPSSAIWWQERVDPADLARLQPLVPELFESSQDLYESEYRIRHQDGHWVDVWERGCLIRDRQGQVIRIVGSTVDISDRKQAQVALAANEARLRGFVESNVVGIIYGDIYGNIHQANDELLRMIGYTREDLRQGRLSWIDITPPEHLPLDELAIAEARANGACTPYEKEYIRRDGSRVPVIIGYSLLGEAREESVAFILDVSDRKRSEEALRQSEERYRCLAELIPQLVWTANAAGALLDVNQRWLDFTGLTPEQALTARWEEIVHPEDLPVLMQQWTQAVQQGTSYQAEGRMRRVDGVYRWHLHQAIGQKNEQGEIIKWFGTATDIETQKQLEIERDRLLQLEQTARAEAERANRIKDEFLAILSHELRSPLNPILGWAKLLQSRKFDVTKTQEALASIERNAKLQTQLIDDLLDVAKILRGKLTMNADAVNLEFVIEAAIDTMKTAAIAKSIQIHPVLNQIGRVSGDAGRLQQVVWNLLSNAIKFTPNNGQVDICLEQVSNSAQITVSDTGKGINPKFLPYIFDSFRQEDASTTRKYGGLGLGLAIVRSLVEAHGGTIWAESKGEGQGAKFTVQLPLLDIEPQKSQTDQLTKPQPEITGIRVLVVDDEADTRELFTALLTQYGAEVMTVVSAAEVLAALESFKPNVLVSDIGMPDVDGYNLIQKIRSLPPASGGQIPAIALTAYARIEDRQRSLLAGFQYHISKPIDVGELLQAISAIVSGSPIR